MQVTRTLLAKAVVMGIISASLPIISGCGGAATPNASANLAPATSGTTTVSTTATSPTTTSAPTPTQSPSPTPAPPPQAINGIPRSSHVVLVIEENHMFTEVYPNGMPWLVS